MVIHKNTICQHRIAFVFVCLVCTYNVHNKYIYIYIHTYIHIHTCTNLLQPGVSITVASSTHVAVNVSDPMSYTA